MIYLNNNTELQTVYIERNDGLGTPSHHSGSYESGYTDGVAYQKSLLSSITITDNGDYSRENGYSAITVDVPHTGYTLQDLNNAYDSGATDGYNSGYDDGYHSGSTDGFASGYSSGSTDGFSSGETAGEQNIINTFTAITATTNGEYGSSAHPLSSVTVDVPFTGHTDQEMEDAYNSGYTSGSTDGYNSGFTSGETHQKSLLSSTAITENGQYLSENGFSAVTVEVPTSGTPSVLGTGSFSANGTYSASTDGLDGYSAITIDLPIGVKYIEYIETTDTRPRLDTGIKFNSLNQSLELDVMVLSPSGYGSNQYLLGTISNKLYIYYDTFHNYIKAGAYGKTHSVEESVDIYYKENKRTKIGISNTGITVDGVVEKSYNKTSMDSTDYTVKLNGSVNYSGGTLNGWYARYYGYKMFSGETLMMDLKPVLDNNDTPCFYDTVSKKLFYFTVTGDGSRIQAGPLVGYLSGYTEGFASGQSSIINTFTAKTVTENGTYGSSAHPLTSITVNVISGVGSLYGLYADEDTAFQFPLPNNTSINNIGFSTAYLNGEGFASILARMSGDSTYEYAYINNDVFYGSYDIMAYSGANVGYSSTTISGHTAEFPNHEYLKLGKGYASYGNISAFTTSSLNNKVDTLEISLDHSFFVSGTINDAYNCLMPYVDEQGVACIAYGNTLYYPTFGKVYPVYQNGNDYYIKMV